MTDNIDYKARCEEYEKRMGIGVYDPAKEGYLVLVGVLNQHNDYLKNINIKSMITTDESGAKSKNEYERAKGLWEGLSKMIENVGNLKVALKMEGEEKKKVYSPISAKEIANGNV